MTSSKFRNVTLATAAGLRDLLNFGSVLHVRGQEVREIRNRITTLRRPRERCLFLPHRNESVFANLAETFWVLAGRSDVAWLQTYLPRAPEFSDDGLTWRGGYGPRLRNWNGVDQLDEVRKLILAESHTRRAVMVLYDPDRDFVSSKDIPCNNWLHWLVRDNHLHLNIAVRSNDAVWGFSGINSFEWSILQEMMSYWVGVPMGDATYFASSFHVYERHYEVAKRISSNFGGLTCYDFGIESPPFQTPWEAFAETLDAWFRLENEIRHSSGRAVIGPNALADPLLDGAIKVLRLHHGIAQGWSTERLRDELAALPSTDLTAATYNFFSRKHPELLDTIAQPALAAFFGAYRAGRNLNNPPGSTALQARVVALHREKDAAYGNSWKRRGELISILANISRKVDRLEVFATERAPLVGETILDTAIDLFVYVTKYRLFLMDLDSEIAQTVLPRAAKPFSDQLANFDQLVHSTTFSNIGSPSAEIQINDIIALFQDLYKAAVTSNNPPRTRFMLATRLGELSAKLVVTLTDDMDNEVCDPMKETEL